MPSNMRGYAVSPTRRAGLNNFVIQSLLCTAEVLPVEYLVECCCIFLGLSWYLYDYTQSA